MNIDQWNATLAQANSAEQAEHPIREMLASLRCDVEDGIIWAVNVTPTFLENILLCFLCAWLLAEESY